MGRFYKTSTPQKLDYIHKLPEQQLSAVLLSKEGELEKEEKALADLDGQLKFNALQKDEARRHEIIGGYEKRIDQYSKTFQEDPLAFLENKSGVRKLSRDIYEDMTRGEANRISGNYDLRTDYLKRYQEAVQKGDRVLAQDLENAMRHFDNEYQGVNWNAEMMSGNVYNTEELESYIDVEEIAEVRGEGYISDITKQWGAYAKDGYLYTSEAMQEIIPYEDIYAGVADAITNDQKVMNYYRQKLKFDPNFTEEDLKSLIHEASARVAEKYDKTHKEAGVKSIKADPFELQKRRFDNQRAAAAAGENRKLLLNAAPNRNNEQYKYSIIAGDAKNFTEWRSAIGEIKDDAENRVYNFSNNLKNIILENQNLNSGEKAILLKKLNPTGNMNEYLDNLEEVASQMNVGVTIHPDNSVELSENKGNGIKELKDFYSRQMVTVDNQNRIMTATISDMINENGSGSSSMGANYQRRLEKAKQKKLEAIRQKLHAEGRFGEIIDPSAYELTAAEENRIALVMVTTDPQYTHMLNQKMQQKDFAVSNESIFSTGGDYYDVKGVPPEDKAMFINHLQKTSANFYDYLAKGQGVQVYVERTSEDGQGKQIQQHVNWDNLVQNGQFNYKQFEQIAKDPDGKHTITMTQEGKPVTFEIGKMRVVPQNIPGIGRNSYQVSMIGSDPKSGKPLSYTIYVPQNNLPASQEIKQFFKSREVDVMTDDFKRSAGMSFKNTGIQSKTTGRTFYKSSNIPNVEYNPYFSDGNQGQGNVVPAWKFTDDNGNSRILMGEEGENAYKDLLRQMGYGDRYESKMNTNYSTSKRQSASVSRTTSK